MGAFRSVPRPRVAISVSKLSPEIDRPEVRLLRSSKLKPANSASCCPVTTFTVIGVSASVSERFCAVTMISSSMRVSPVWAKAGNARPAPSTSASHLDWFCGILPAPVRIIIACGLQKILCQLCYRQSKKNSRRHAPSPVQLLVRMHAIHIPHERRVDGVAQQFLRARGQFARDVFGYRQQLVFELPGPTGAVLRRDDGAAAG